MKILRMLQAGLGVAILIAAVSSQAKGNDNRDSQSCRDDLRADPASNVASDPSRSTVSSTGPHSVRLSWNTSMPASNSPGDAIRGYNVYRRERGKKYEQINTELIQGTSCVDYLVKSGHTYHYATRAISANGAVSQPSLEAKAVISSR
jgi:hypothetical protein